MSITFTTHLIREPLKSLKSLKSKSDDWREFAHKWLVTINGQEFAYYTGPGHREERKKGFRTDHTYAELKQKNLTPSGLKSLLELSKAVPPSLDDVLSCLVLDASAAEMSFSDWCSDFGYDTDSRKAFSTYEQCRENADKLRKAGINISAERERLADY